MRYFAERLSLAIVIFVLSVTLLVTIYAWAKFGIETGLITGFAIFIFIGGLDIVLFYRPSKTEKIKKERDKELSEFHKESGNNPTLR